MSDSEDYTSWWDTPINVVWQNGKVRVNQLRDTTKYLKTGPDLPPSKKAVLSHCVRSEDRSVTEVCLVTGPDVMSSSVLDLTYDNWHQVDVRSDENSFFFLWIPFFCRLKEGTKTKYGLEKDAKGHWYTTLKTEEMKVWTKITNGLHTKSCLYPCCCSYVQYRLRLS